MNQGGRDVHDHRFAVPGPAGVIATAVIPVGGGRRARRSRADVVPAGARSGPGRAAAIGSPTCARCSSRTSIWITPAPRGRLPRGCRAAGLRPRASAPGTWPAPRSCWRARRASTAPRWTRCGASSGPCRRPRFDRWPAARSLDLDGRRFDVAYTPGHAVAPRELPRSQRRHRLRRRYGRDPGPPRLCAAGDAAAGHRSRALGREPPADRGVAPVAPLPDAFRRGRGAGRPPGDVSRGAGPRRRPRCGRRFNATAMTRRGSAEWEHWLRADVRAAVPEAAAEAMEVAAPFRQLWLGLARYWRKRDEAAAVSRSAGHRHRASEVRRRGLDRARRLDQEAQRVAARRARAASWATRRARPRPACALPAAAPAPGRRSFPAAGAPAGTAGSAPAHPHSTNAPVSLTSRVVTDANRTAPELSFQVSRAGKATRCRAAARGAAVTATDE